MAISRIEESKYLSDLLFVQDHLAKPYAKEVLEILKEQGISGINEMRIYNIVRGTTRDRKILDAILKLIENRKASAEGTQVDLSNLKLEQA